MICRLFSSKLCLVDVDVGEEVSPAADASELELVHDDGLGLFVDDGVDVGVAGVAGEVIEVGDFVGVDAHVDFHACHLGEVPAVLVGEDFATREALDGDDHPDVERWMRMA